MNEDELISRCEYKIFKNAPESSRPFSIQYNPKTVKDCVSLVNQGLYTEGQAANKVIYDAVVIPKVCHI